jgi:hypothetical protein
MPFPLAHPAAVLPFRRNYFKWLNFPALAIGSLVPDLGYLLPHGRDISHQVFGSILFSVPVGTLILAAFYVLRTRVVSRMNAGLKQFLLPLCRRPSGPAWILLLSLIIGVETHVLWDSFTHRDGWLTLHVPFLLSPVVRFDGRTARLCTVIWYGSSVIGVGWLFMAFEKWKQNAVTAAGGRSENGKGTLQDAIFLAILVIPASLAHHLIRSPIGFVLTAAFCLSFGIVFIWKMAVATG